MQRCSAVGRWAVEGRLLYSRAINTAKCEIECLQMMDPKQGQFNAPNRLRFCQELDHLTAAMVKSLKSGLGMRATSPTHFLACTSCVDLRDQTSTIDGLHQSGLLFSFACLCLHLLLASGRAQYTEHVARRGQKVRIVFHLLSDRQLHIVSECQGNIGL